MKSVISAPRGAVELVESTYDTKPNPPTVDDILDAQCNGTLNAARHIQEAVDVLRRAPIQQFNFGPLSLDTIREAQQEALEFINYGVFQLPYTVCMYRCSICYDNQTVGFTILMMDGRTMPDVAHKTIHGYGIAAIGFIHSPKDVCAMHSINMLKTQLQKEGPAVEIQIPAIEIKHWHHQLFPTGVAFDPLHLQAQQMTEGSLIGMALTMILNTKGIHKERVPYAEKPNARRIKAGRPPLPYITRVSTTLYNEASRKGEPGTHASPRPHRRRAHVRHMPASGKREAYMIPIAAMLVNWDGQPIEERKGYEVK